MAGHSVRKQDSIGALTKFSSTEVRLAASTITVGGLQYETSTLSCVTNTNGAGGLDIGTIAANNKYYVYAVLSAGDVALVCSLSDSAPSGFTSSNSVGYFWTGSSTAVLSVNEKTLLSGDAHGTSTKGGTTSPYYLATTVSNTISSELGTVSPDATATVFYTAVKKQRVFFSIDARGNNGASVTLNINIPSTDKQIKSSSINPVSITANSINGILEVGETIEIEGYNYTGSAPGKWQLYAEEIE